MGEKKVTRLSRKESRAFTHALLDDLRALEEMIADGRFETNRRRIGSEQEAFLVNQSWHPASCALELLKRLDDPRFTTEIGLFNLEINLDPIDFAPGCFQQLDSHLHTLLDRLHSVAAQENVRVVLCGILPTLTRSDVHLRNMTPHRRYELLNDAVRRMRGQGHRLHIKGADEFNTTVNTVMLESFNTSFQIHLQVSPDEFANLYNIAQVSAAPTLAAATNSPLLFGRRLWRETRIALFQQVIDTRRPSHHLRNVARRVSFGSGWVNESVLEIFREDVARYRALVTISEIEDPFRSLEDGHCPRLDALRVFNSTVYRWNRPCYGVNDESPHLRIENRTLPTGPTTRDEIANAAFFYGLMCGLSDLEDNVKSRFHFDAVKENFLASARSGLDAQFRWMDGRSRPARDLILQELLPLAREGLTSRGFETDELDDYLGIVQERVETGQTGSQWLLDSLAGMDPSRSPDERMTALTAGLAARQKEGHPVSQWTLATLPEAGDWKPSFRRVEQYMTTDLFTVGRHDAIELALNIMNWEGVRHVPVEDRKNHLLGIVSYRSIMRLFGEARPDLTASVSTLMTREPVTVSPETSTLKVIELMKQHGISALPVVSQGHLVGIVTQRDLMNIAREVLIEQLGRESDG